MASEQKEKLIRFYKGTEGEETVVKLVDLVDRSYKTNICPTPEDVNGL